MLLLLSPYNFLQAQDQQNHDRQELAPPDTTKPVKSVYIDLGYGYIGMSGAIGFRYWIFAFSMGVAGITNSIPPYSYLYPPDKNFEEQSFTAFAVCGDFTMFYNIRQFEVFGSVGYYQQADTVLAYYPKTGDHYRYQAKNTDGITFGAGMQFRLSHQIILGIGLHSKRGVFARFMYCWY